MYIKSYKTRRFAGLKDIEVNFLKGLNVILGPNEAGKSSIIEGMHATLFQDVKLRKSTNRDRNFIYKYMPKPDGDFIDGQLTINNLKGDYSIFKEWGSSELVELVNADNNLVKDEVRVNKILSKLLLFNEGTYSNIIFAKQRHIKQALEKIIQDDGVTQEVNDILRKTLMDLDGVSLDAIETNLNIAVENLYKRWDIEKNYPINNRGISNPYVNNRGAILDSYYNKEELKIKMDETKKLEKAFDVANQKLQEVNKEIEALKLEKVDLESIEEDVNQRALLEVSIAPIKKDVEELFAINREWPLTVENIKNLSQKEVSLKEKGEELIKEKSSIAKVERKIFLNEKLKTVESILKNIKEKQNKLKDIPQINDQELLSLSKLKSLKDKLVTTMQAGKMLGVLKKSGSSQAYISKDFNEKVKLNTNKQFSANGLINITYGDDFEVEIKTGEIDFDQLNKEYSKTKEEFNILLSKLKVESVEAARYNLESIKKINREIEDLNKDLKRNLDNLTIEEIKAEIESLKDYSSVRSLNEIEKDLEFLSNQQSEISFELRSKKADLDLWTSKYKSHDNLFEAILEKRGKLQTMEDSLSELLKLPDKFATALEFKDRLAFVRSKLATLESDLVNVRLPEFYAAEKKTAGPTYLELKRQYLEAEKTFNRNIEKGKTLLKVVDNFNKTKERLFSNPMESLEKEFLKYLNLTTVGKYAKGEIDENFNLSLQANFGQLPTDLLSAGTYDAVTLSLRLALVSHMFKDSKGFVVLDDVLVDLDPKRKLAAINLIQEFSKDHQVIFTTCSPDTAKILGGNIIKI